MKFGEKLKQERKKRGMTQQELAKVLGITCRTLQNYEAGSVYPKKRDLYHKLAAYFATTVDFWLQETAPFQIVPLTGPDRVRKRSGVIFGSEDREGAQCAVEYLLELFATEARLGHCTRLSVESNGIELVISGNDRGLYLGQDTGDDSVWQEIFCQLYPGPKFGDRDGGYCYGLVDNAHYRLYGQNRDEIDPWEGSFLELYAVQCVCRVMDVTVCRNGVESTLHFQRGHNQGGISHKPTDASNGTRFCFVLDEAVFSQTVITGEFFRKTLSKLSMLCPGLVCSYQAFDDAPEVFARPAEAGYEKKITARGRDRYNRAEYEGCVEVSIRSTPGKGQLICCHNFRELKFGGAHLEAFKTRLCSLISDSTGRSLNFETLTRDLTMVVATWCSPHSTRWINGARQGISNEMLRDMTWDALADFRPETVGL